ncbi:MAG: hypothetical protein J3Q66DRAFT_354565 [Benniella sp.]|nr:MAG: hypothetical protein J3Q66DRAFT_354565 [Benniella sp.]
MAPKRANPFIQSSSRKRRKNATAAANARWGISEVKVSASADECHEACQVPALFPDNEVEGEQASPRRSWEDILPAVYETDKTHLRSSYRGDSETTRWRDAKRAREFEAIANQTCRKLTEFPGFSTPTHRLAPCNEREIEDELCAGDDVQEGLCVEGDGQEDEEEDDEAEEVEVEVEDVQVEDVEDDEYEYVEDDDAEDDDAEDDDAGDDECEEDELETKVEGEARLTNEDGKALLARLDAKMKDKKVLKSISEDEREKINAVRFYLRGLQNGYEATKLRQAIAVLHGRSPYFATRIRAWALELERFGELKSKRGKHTRTNTLLADAEVRLELQSWLDSPEVRDRISPELLRKKVCKDWFNDEGGISLTTAKRWLKKLGWERSRTGPGLYDDGHERKDVVEYRMKFVEEMKSVERRMMRFPGHRPEGLLEGERPLIFYTHDEVSFHSNDGQRFKYHRVGKRPLYRQTHEDCWNGAKLAVQFEKLIEYHKRVHPDCDAVVAFDNATSHLSLALDALDARRMNVKPGGADCKNTYRPKGMWYLKDGNRIEQSYLEEDGVTTKGIRRVLEERGLPVKDLKAGKCTTRCPDRPDNSNEPFCCQAKLLSSQPDFKSQGTMLQEASKNHEEVDVRVVYYPKFHCELNYIEMYWGQAKRKTRASCDYTLKGLKVAIPVALDSIPVDMIRRFASRSFRYMEEYRNNSSLTGQEAERQMKKYTSHRRISERQFNTASKSVYSDHVRDMIRNGKMKAVDEATDLLDPEDLEEDLEEDEATEEWLKDVISRGPPYAGPSNWEENLGRDPRLLRVYYYYPLCLIY